MSNIWQLEKYYFIKSEFQLLGHALFNYHFYANLKIIESLFGIN